MLTFSSFAEAARWAAEEFVAYHGEEALLPAFTYEPVAWFDFSPRRTEVRVAGDDWDMQYGPGVQPACGNPGTYVVGNAVVELQDESNYLSVMFSELAPDESLPSGHRVVLSIEAADGELRYDARVAAARERLLQDIDAVVVSLQQAAARDAGSGATVAAAAAKLRGLLEPLRAAQAS